jgi:integrase
MYAPMARQYISRSKIGTQPLDKLRPSHIEAWKVELQHRGLSESTIWSAYTNLLRAVLDTAEAAYLTPDHVRSLLLAAKSSRYASLFELVHTGLRRGEALALHWSDIDLDAKLLRISGTLARVGGQLIVTETKTPSSRRVIPLSPTAERLLRDLRANQRAERLRAGSMWQPTPYVSTTELGESCDPRNALRALKASATRCEGCAPASDPLSVSVRVGAEDATVVASTPCGGRTWDEPS